MCLRHGRVLIGPLASLFLLSACETSSKVGDLFQSSKSDGLAASASATSEPAITGTTAAIVPGAAAPGDLEAKPGLLGSDAYADLNMGKKFYRTGNYGLAERYFRRAVEQHPRDAEAWVGLAAAYDELKRFDLADRAYEQAIAIIGITPEVLNNKGYSYMLRGDYARARATLLEAQKMDPSNPFVQNNLALLAKSVRKGKSVQ